MSAQAIRIRKEARQLFWAWALVTGAGVLALLREWWQPAWLGALPGVFEELLGGDWILAVGVAFGIPLLATLPLGYEFQYRTLPVLLSGSLARTQIWREKIGITLAAIVLPGAIFLLDARSLRLHDHDLPAQLGFGAVLLILAGMTAMSASAMYFALVARGTIGALALNYAVTWSLFAGGAWMAANVNADGPVPPFVPITATVFLLVYSAVMVWLGRRALLRYQAVDGVAAGDPLDVLAARVVPRVLANLLVARPNSAVLNLVRKEVRLLRPVWALALLTALVWAVLVWSGMVPMAGRKPASQAAAIAAVLTTFLSPLMAVLAGVLSLGEDKQYGTHEWHMTLPVSRGVQWAIKLLMAMVASLACAVLLPLAVVSAPELLGRPGASGVTLHDVWLGLQAAAVMTLVSFWLACAVKSTVRAALGVVPALLGGLLIVQFGAWAAEGLTAASFALIDRVFFRFEPFWITRFAWWQLYSWEVLLVLALPVAGFIVLHSFRLFRGQPEDTARTLLRAVSPLAAVILLSSFAVGGGLGVLMRGQEQIAKLFRETHSAIVTRQPEAWRSGGPPLRLPAAELAQQVRLSDSTRYWLGDGVITVVPRPERRPDFGAGYSFNFSDPANRRAVSYQAVVPLANGSSCTLLFVGVGAEMGLLGGTC